MTWHGQDHDMTTKDKNHRLTSDYSNTPLPLLCYAPSAGGNMNALTRTLGQRNVNIVSSQVHSPLYCVFAHDIAYVPVVLGRIVRSSAVFHSVPVWRATQAAHRRQRCAVRMWLSCQPLPLNEAAGEQWSHAWCAMQSQTLYPYSQAALAEWTYRLIRLDDGCRLLLNESVQHGTNMHGLQGVTCSPDKV